MLKLSPQLNLLVPPIAFFAVNGLVVIFFKIYELNIQLFLPVILSVTSVTLIASFFKLKSEPQLQKLLFVAISFGVFLGSCHLYFYGTSLGPDGNYYFVFPLYAFFHSEVFSLGIEPFVTFGSQPLSTYWLHANFEYFSTAIGAALNLEYINIATIMHFSSLFFFGYILVVATSIWTPLRVIPLILVIFLLVLYTSSTQLRSLGSTILFRGFEHKSLIWGFFTFACLTLFFLTKNSPHNGKTWFGFGSLFAVSSLAVSGNAVFLALPALSFLLIGIGQIEYRKGLPLFFGIVINVGIYLISATDTPVSI